MEPQNNYSVSLKVPDDYNNTTAYLVDWDSAQKMDSVIVTEGLVKFQGNVGTPKMARFMVNGNRGPIFVLESGNIEFVDGKLGCTPLNDKFQS